MKKILALSLVFLMAAFGVKAPEALAGTNQVFSWTYGQNFDNTQDTYNLPLAASGVNWTTTEADVTYKVKNPFIIKDFRTRLTTTPGGGKTVTVVIRKNGADTALSNLMSDTSEVLDADSVQFYPGDTISIKASPSGTPTASGIRVSLVMQINKPNVNYYFSTSSGNPNASSVRYFPIHGGNAFTATEGSGVLFVVSTAGTFSNLYAEVGTVAGSGKSFTVTARKNLADTALTTSISGTSQTTNSDLTHSFSAVPGDVVCLAITPSGTPTLSKMKFNIQFNPTTDGEFMLPSSSLNSPSTSAANNKAPIITNAASSWSSTDNATSSVYTNDFVVKGIAAYAVSAPGSGKSWTVTMSKNSSSTAVTTAIADTAQSAYSDGYSVSIADSETFNLVSTPAGTPTSGNLLMTLTGYNLYSTKTKWA